MVQIRMSMLSKGDVECLSRLSVQNSVKKVLLCIRCCVAAWLLRFVNYVLFERRFDFQDFRLRLAVFSFLHKVSGSCMQSRKVLFGVLQNCATFRFCAIMV